MSINTKIQWCDSTVNPAMGCDGCELFPSPSQILAVIRNELVASGVKASPEVNETIASTVHGKLATGLYHSRKTIAAKLLRTIRGARNPISQSRIDALARAIAKPFICYAGMLHLRYGRNGNKPKKRGKKGFAPVFEQVTRFPGRMAAAAAWPDLRGIKRDGKPWLDGLPRLIFLSDMGDLLSSEIDFAYIRHEVIANVASDSGRRHVWLWLTKRPHRMAKFSEWLEAQGVVWPDNLVAMTSVTSQRTVGRVAQLKKVRCRFHGISVEPLWSAVTLPLKGINWVIVGGESGGGATPFQLQWARDIQKQCKTSGAAYFLKQLGTRPSDNGNPLALKHGHGGDWTEWPKELRVRQLPAEFGV